MCSTREEKKTPTTARVQGVMLQLLVDATGSTKGGKKAGIKTNSKTGGPQDGGPRSTADGHHKKCAKTPLPTLCSPQKPT